MICQMLCIPPLDQPICKFLICEDTGEEALPPAVPIHSTHGYRMKFASFGEAALLFKPLIRKLFQKEMLFLPCSSWFALSAPSLVLLQLAPLPELYRRAVT